MDKVSGEKIPNNDVSSKLGDMVVVTTCNEILYGKVAALDLCMEVVELEDVEDLCENVFYEDKVYLNFNSIKKVTDCYEGSKLDEIQEIIAVRKYLNILYGFSGDELNLTEKFKITAKKLKHIEECLENVKIIRELNNNYHKAIEDLDSQNTISIIATPLNACRQQQLSVLCAATNRSIYIFDVLALNDLGAGLKRILTADSPRKVLYKGINLNDNLVCRHKVTLNGVFDIFVTYCLLTKSCKNVQLTDIIEKELLIPKDYFEFKANLYEHRRPLKKEFIRTLGKLAAIQLHLSNHFLYDKLIHCVNVQN